MYGRQAKFTAQAGARAAFIEILTRAAALVGQLPGCHMYAVGEALSDEDTIYVTEIWADKAAHAASLEHEGVRSLIQEALPLMAGPPEGVEMRIAALSGMINEEVAQLQGHVDMDLALAD